jgi:hypothetical protein
VIQCSGLKSSSVLTSRNFLGGRCLNHRFVSDNSLFMTGSSSVKLTVQTTNLIVEVQLWQHLYFVLKLSKDSVVDVSANN